MSAALLRFGLWLRRRRAPFAIWSWPVRWSVRWHLAQDRMRGGR